jgi:uncharacterized Zn-binding protein involved in type VI secretion
MPAISRVGDSLTTGHGCDSTTIIESGSPNVFVNGLAVARIGDPTPIHLEPGGAGCVPHVAVITEGSSSVFVNGLAVARVGDAVDIGAMTQGSPNVFAGG